MTYSLHNRGKPGVLARWLLIVAALIIAIVVVGGITRLTESGLSITEWKPVTGALPPLSESQWQAEFDAYKQIPEYREITGPAGMTLAHYKHIYFWEWFHRLLARSIGLAFALPLAWFWQRGAIPSGYLPRLLALLALGGLQGAVGWWMVRSGLTHQTDVSHFRLAIHLLVALATLGGLVWTALDLKALEHDPHAKPAAMTGLAALALAALLLQLLLGAWVAGLNAGYMSNHWPAMEGGIWPVGIDWSSGAGYAFTHDRVLLHFNHRWWAWVVAVILIVMARRVKRAGASVAAIAIHGSVGTQIVLGIATVLSNVALWLAAAHQLVGALLVVATTWGAHALGRRGR